MSGHTLKNVGANNMQFLNKLKRYWKEAAAVVVVLILTVNPSNFVILNLEPSVKFVMAVIGLLLLRLAKSAWDTWMSKPLNNKKVSVSRFMQDEKTSDLSKAIIHASQTLAIALVIIAAFMRG